MKEQTRNVAVGLTVLVGLAMLVVMILLFAGLPGWLQSGYTVRIDLTWNPGLVAGDAVHLRGKRVGVVRDVVFTDGDPSRGITVIAEVDGDLRLPTNLRAYIDAQGLTGKGYLSLYPDDPSKTGPDGEPLGYFEPGQDIYLSGISRRGSGMIPQEVTDALADFGKLARNLNQLIAPEPDATAQPTTDTGQPTSAPSEPPGLQGTLAKLNATLDGLHAIVGDAENQQNLKASLANLAAATAKAETAMDDLQTVLAGGRELVAGGQATVDKARELMTRLVASAETLGGVLTEVRATVRTMQDGDGTVAKLLNDAQLYRNLVTATEQIETTVAEFRKLAEQWQAEGVPIKLK